MSRWYSGIHFRDGDLAGRRMEHAGGTVVRNKALRYIKGYHVL